MRRYGQRPLPKPQLLSPALLGVAVALTAGALLTSGCGGSDTPTATTTKGTRAAAISLQDVMNRTATSFDEMHKTRASLEVVGSSLKPGIAQTNDVVVALTPLASTGGTERSLLNAARQQRSFLQHAADAAQVRSSGASRVALNRARIAGRSASTMYSTIARNNAELAGIVPASTTFATGRLRDAVRHVHKRKTTKRTDPQPTSGTSSSSGSSCGGGLSVNSVTSCAFAQNVSDTYYQSGRSGTLTVWSPTTQQYYTMFCSGSNPVTCTGGNNAAIYIR